MGKYIAAVDCRTDNTSESNFLELNLWGSPLFTYAVNAVLNCPDIDKTIVVTDNNKIKNIALNINGVTVSEEMPRQTGVIVVSGCAAFLKSRTLSMALDMYRGGLMLSAAGKHEINPDYSCIMMRGKSELEPVNVFYIDDGSQSCPSFYELDDNEALAVDSVNNFELALVLRKKEINAEILKQNILNDINNKKSIMQSESDGICMIGHSQIDRWKTESISGLKVRNCGISGISSFEYNDYILEQSLIKCNENKYIVMHGTNDIIYNYSIDEICRSIRKTIEYIRARKPYADIYFINCLHTNGRMDRSNKTIDVLNKNLYECMSDVRWISTPEMDNEYGELNPAYTEDGLHLNEKGYALLQSITEREMENE
ncbi:MAG: GDSL-type esterase/lipase family protein [Lachnospiraceae bacterium]|nr:GDSL-type esterase/lipase family protein [Lachnospiraceae bacterium]